MRYYRLLVKRRYIHAYSFRDVVRVKVNNVSSNIDGDVTVTSTGAHLSLVTSTWAASYSAFGIVVIWVVIEYLTW